MFKKDFNSILELLDMFPDEQSCIDYLEEVRWGGILKISLHKVHKKTQRMYKHPL